MTKPNLVQIAIFAVIAFSMFIAPTVTQIVVQISCIAILAITNPKTRDQAQAEIIEHLEFVKKQLSNIGVKRLGR